MYARSHPLHHAAANQPATAPIASQVYNVTSGKTLPQWLSENKKSSLKRNDDYLRRLELIQDFEFPAACQRLKVTPDQQFIFATGYHPPMVRAGRVCVCMGLHGGSMGCGHMGAVCRIEVALPPAITHGEGKRRRACAHDEGT